MIGIYGMVLMTAFLSAGAVAYLFDQHGVIQRLRGIWITSPLLAEDTSQWQKQVTSREKPTLEVKTKKLQVNQSYDLTGEEFEVYVCDADKKTLYIEEIQILDPTGEETVYEEVFIPSMAGVYQMQYLVAEEYLGVRLETRKTYRFLVDEGVV
jgi:uncharacterized membrane protein